MENQLKRMLEEDAKRRIRRRSLARLIETLEEDSEDEEQPKRRGGSVAARKTINRSRVEGHDRLYADYFSDDPVYPESLFRRRFRMSRNVFDKILKGLIEKHWYFPQKYDAALKPGLTPLQKATAAIRQLAYGVSADTVDEYVRCGESTALQCLEYFCEGVIENHGEEYLRSPTKEDLDRIFKNSEGRGFPGMIGSLDCMHWEWKNCPSGWKGQYQGKEKVATIILEAVADYETWIWHAHFGLPGSLNDINVLHRSPLFSNTASDLTPAIKFTVNGHEYDKGYYLVDGIYPPWAMFVNTISYPVEQKKKLFARMQEAWRKDVERAFGILQARFAVIRLPAKLWDLNKLAIIMKACIIMHNMIIESDREDRDEVEEREEVRCEGPVPSLVIERNPNTMREFFQRYSEIRDEAVHNQLKKDLIEHLWAHHGNSA